MTTDAAWKCEQTDDRVEIEGPDWRISIRRRGGRWLHGLSFGDFDPVEIERWPLISSVESDRDAEDPTRVASPVYEELQRRDEPETSAKSVRLALSGKHFQHDFSAVLTVGDDPEEPGTIVANFDIANDCRGEVNSFAATYLVRLNSGALLSADSESIVWAGGPLGDGTLTFRVGPGAALALAEAGRHSSRIQALAGLKADSSTHQLRYQWRWATASGRTR